MHQMLSARKRHFRLVNRYRWWKGKTMAANRSIVRGTRQTVLHCLVGLITDYVMVGRVLIVPLVVKSNKCMTGRKTVSPIRDTVFLPVMHLLDFTTTVTILQISKF